MKKIITLLVSVFLFINSYSQITQEEVIVSKDISHLTVIELETHGRKYLFVDQDELIIKIYNLDNSLFKSIELNKELIGILEYPQLEGALYPFYISESLFDSDSDLEFVLVIFAFTEDWSGNLYKTIILNEDGSTITEMINQTPVVDYKLEQYPPDWISNTENGSVMFLGANSKTENDSLFIYSLPGQVPCLSCTSTPTKTAEVKSVKTKSLSNPYPNPAKSYTKVDYTLPENETSGELIVFNLNGVEIKRYKVDNTFNHLKISTSDLSAGTYFYKLKTASTISESKKVVVVK